MRWLDGITDSTDMSLELSEERTINPNARGVNLAQEQKLLWDSVNESVDNQIIDIKNAFAKHK